jgi:hypothetical protein
MQERQKKAQEEVEQVYRNRLKSIIKNSIDQVAQETGMSVIEVEQSMEVLGPALEHADGAQISSLLVETEDQLWDIVYEDTSIEVESGKREVQQIRLYEQRLRGRLNGFRKYLGQVKETLRKVSYAEPARDGTLDSFAGLTPIADIIAASEMFEMPAMPFNLPDGEPVVGDSVLDKGASIFLRPPKHLD